MTGRLRILLVISVCAAGFGLSATADARFIPGLNQVRGAKGEVYRKGCLMGHTRLRSGPCRFGDLDSNRKVVLFGDSHAMQWGPGLIQLAKVKGWKVIALTRASCPAALVHIDYYCNRWRRNSLRRIRRMRPGLIVVSSAANFEAYRVSGLDRSSSERHLFRGMVRTLRMLNRWSKKTVVLRDQAVTPFSVTRCLRSNARRPSRCGFRPHRPRAYSYDYKATRRVRGVRLIDPQPMLCPRGWCKAVDENHLVYRNHGHLASTFTRFKYDWLGHKLPDPWPEVPNPYNPKPDPKPKLEKSFDRPASTETAISGG